MHIPDGFLDTKTWTVTATLSGGFLAYSVKRAKAFFKEKQIPLMGVLASFIFAAQMLNFPVAGGTSGHFLGAALASIFLGPWAAAIIMSTVLIIQALIFADGGITALGANILNMAIIGSFVSYWIYSSFIKISPKLGRSLGVFAAAWFSVVTSSVACSLELAASHTASLFVVLPAMAGWHALIGVGEGIITVSVVALVYKVRPDLFKLAPEADYKILVAGVIISVLLAFVLSPFASALPDGLEYVGEKLGFIDKAKDIGFKAPIPDYVFPSVKSEPLATATAGLVGTLLTLGAAYGVSLLVTRKKKKKATT